MLLPSNKYRTLVIRKRIHEMIKSHEDVNMTNQESIDTLRCALGCGCCQVCNAKYRGDCTDEQVLEALNNAVTALEKQVAKKPLADNVGGYSAFICPFCECNYVNNKQFCDCCGQKIDWGN